MAARAATVLPAPSRRVAPSRRPTRPVPARNPRRRSSPGRTDSPGLVGRSARAAMRLPDSGAVRGVSRSRLWIVVIGLLLAGIVAVNVVAVSYATQASQNQSAIQELERQNSILRSAGIEAISMPTVITEASEAGMAHPDPTSIRYLEHSPSDIAAAAQRLAAEGG